MSSPSDGGLAERVETLERDIASLVETFERFRRESPPPVWSWLSTDDPESARVILADLADWVHEVWFAWPDAHLPVCWMQHPDVVETLWALRNLWGAHERRGGTWAQRVDWIERYRPAAAKRLQQYFSTHDHADEISELPELPSLDAIHAAADEHCAASPITSTT